MPSSTSNTSPSSPCLPQARQGICQGKCTGGMFWDAEQEPWFILLWGECARQSEEGELPASRCLWAPRPRSPAWVGSHCSQAPGPTPLCTSPENVTTVLHHGLTQRSCSCRLTPNVFVNCRQGAVTANPITVWVPGLHLGQMCPLQRIEAMCGHSAGITLRLTARSCVSSGLHCIFLR